MSTDLCELNLHQVKEAYKNGADWLVIGRDITKGNIKNNIQKLINHLNK